MKIYKYRLKRLFMITDGKYGDKSLHADVIAEL